MPKRKRRVRRKRTRKRKPARRKRPKKLDKHAYLLVALIIILAAGLMAAYTVPPPEELPREIVEKPAKTKLISHPELGDFCGFSTLGPCAADGDCMLSGCSLQICQSQDEEPVVTTCEWKDCYDKEQYAVDCVCIDSQCQWAK